MRVTIAAIVLLSIAGAVAGRLLPEHECSACEVTMETLAASLFDVLPAGSIEVGQALNEPSSYVKIAYATSEYRVMEAVDALCPALAKGSYAFAFTYSRSVIVNATRPHNAANVSLAHPAVRNPARSLRDACYDIVGAHEEAIVAAVYASFDEWREHPPRAVRALCGHDLVAACDYSDAAADALAARDAAAAAAHAVWLAADAERRAADIEADRARFERDAESALIRLSWSSDAADAARARADDLAVKIEALRDELADAIGPDDAARVAADLEETAAAAGDSAAQRSADEGSDADVLTDPVLPIHDALPVAEALPAAVVAEIEEKGAALDEAKAEFEAKREAQMAAFDVNEAAAEQVSTEVGRIERLKKEVARKEGRAERKEEQAKKVRREAVQLRKDAEAAAAELAAAEAALEDTRAAMGEAAAAIDAAQAELDAAHARMKATKDAIADLRLLPADRIARSLADSLAELAKARATQADEEGKAAEAKAEHETLIARAASLAEEVEEIRANAAAAAETAAADADASVKPESGSSWW